MSRQFSLVAMLVAGGLVLVTGCYPQQPFYFHEKGDLSQYKGMATEIDYPDDHTPSIPDAQRDCPPLTLSSPEPQEVWELSLQDAMRMALANSKVMKYLGAAAINLAGSTGPQAPSYLLSNAGQAAPSIYDPALTETDGRFGVEAALSAFDTQLSVSSEWGKTDTPENLNTTFSTYGFPAVNISDTCSYQAKLQKVDAAGATVAVENNIQYLASNNTSQEFPSAYTVNLQAEIRQPLLRGRGVEFNEIAGPGAQPGINNGVVIARVNTDIALAQFEAQVRNMVQDVENVYWELYFSYRNLDSVVTGRNSALTTWRRIHILYKLGAKGGEADREAQAREQYFLFRSAVERAQSSLYKAEANLRYVMGLASTDGRLIRPCEEPTTAKVDFDWCTIHNEALVRSVELRQQRWTIKRRELELIAAKNYLLPQLDFVGDYRYIGLGHELLSANSTDPTGFAFNNLTLGHNQEWDAGIQLTYNIGSRRELANLRNAQLRLTRERAVLQEQELELSHQLAFAVRDLDTNYVLSRTDFNRRIASLRQVEAVQAAYDTGTVTIDVLLNAQRLLAQDESDYYRAVVDYNKAIANVHYRKGSLLEYNGVYLAEGPWPAKAYFDATRLARARGAAQYMDYTFAQPRVVSRGPYRQMTGAACSVPMGPLAPESAVPTPSPETVPAPSPTGTPQASPSSLQPTPGSQTSILPSAAQGGTGGWSASAGRARSGQLPVAPAGVEGLAADGTGGLSASGGQRARADELPVAPGNAADGQAWSAVRQSSYQSAAGTNESDANAAAPEPDWSASGWRRAQR